MRGGGDVALFGRQLAQGIGEPRLLGWRTRLGHVEPGERAQPRLLVSVVTPEEVVRDPEQPRPHLAALRVITLAGGEGTSKRLRSEIAGEIRPQAPRQVGVDHVEVELEELLERLRSHNPILPEGASKVPGQSVSVRASGDCASAAAVAGGNVPPATGVL
jgi:hypothetical protein